MSDEQGTVSGPSPSGADPADTGGGWWTSRAAPVVIVIAAVALIGAIVLVARQEQDAGVDVLSGTTVDASTLPVTVPYRELAGYLVVDVALGDGGRTVPMMLDSGGPTVVSEAVAETFATGASGAVAAVSPGGEVVTSEVVRLPRLSIGGAWFDDVGAVVGSIEPGNPLACLIDAGFIGASLMQTAAWYIDPSEGTVTIAATADDLPVAPGSQRLTFDRASAIAPSPGVELPAGEGSLRVVFDTGSDGWLAVSPADFEAVGGTIPPDAPVQERLAIGGALLPVSRVAWSTTQVGMAGAADVEPPTMPIAVIDTLPVGQGIAGTDLLRHFALTIDWSEDVVYLSPLDDVRPALPATATLAWDDGFVVGSKVADAPGAEDLALGAPVSAIDGRDVSAAPFADFCQHLLGGPESYELTVADADEAVTVSVSPAAGFFDTLADD